MFPEYLEDWIDEDNPVRVIDVFVEELDLGELGFSGVGPEVTGRASFLLKLYIYGYLNRLQSSRQLEREALRNVEVMWLVGHLASPITRPLQTSARIIVAPSGKSVASLSRGLNPGSLVVQRV